MKVVEFVRQSPSCVKRCKSIMKVCELSDESSDVVRCDAKSRDVLRLSGMYIGDRKDVGRGRKDVGRDRRTEET